MKYNFVLDSSCELPEEILKEIKPTYANFSVSFHGKKIDESISQEELIEILRKNDDAPSTAAPSPGDFLEGIKKEGETFCVTISSKLSAAFQNANLAKNIFLEDFKKNINVFDSLSASAGESLVVLKIKEYIDKGFNFSQIVEMVEKFIKDMRTYFVLDSIENLRKNGRLSTIRGFVMELLSIKPVLCGHNGEIKLKAKARGLKAAQKKLLDIVLEDKEKLDGATVVITHFNSEENANRLSEKIKQYTNVKDIYVLKTNLLSSVYADNGGIIISY